MAKYELNIYCKNNEIEKTYATDMVLWGFYLEAVDASDKIENEDIDVREQFEIINGFVKRLFVGLTDDELNRASGDDVLNLFKQLIRKGRSIVGSKNPTAAGK